MNLLEFRVLTVRPPWSAFIAAGQKLTENRVWQTHHRGLIAIHAASVGDWNGFKHPAAADRVVAAASPWLDVKGAIVALAEIDDCHPFQAGCCSSPWADRDGGVWHWVLADVRPLPTPFYVKGRLGLWRPTMNTIERVSAQFEVAR